MNRTLILLTLVILGLAQILSADEPFLVYSASRVAHAPVIDGKLDDACWQTAAKTAPFVMIGGGKVAWETRGMACWDSKNVYIAMVCPESMMSTIRQFIAEGKMSFMEESIEIFIDSDYDQHTYLQLRVDNLGRRDTHRGNDEAPELNSKWSGAAAINDDSWSIEVAVPFKFLGGNPPSASAMWGLNLNRQRVIQRDGMWTCWSDTKGGFHSPNRFGHLIFFPCAEWLRAYVEKEVGALRTETKDLKDTYPSILEFWTKGNESLDQTHQNFLQEVTTGQQMTEMQFSGIFAKAKALIKSYDDLLADLRLEVLRNEFR